MMSVQSERDPSLLSVGAVAATLGVAPETLRSWGTRYGLRPSHRSAGGHRRYTVADLAVLLHMQQLVSEGLSTAQAAQRAMVAPVAERGEMAPPSQPRSVARGGGGGRILAIPGATAEVRGLARAAVRLDAGALMGVLGDLLAERGVIRTWDEVLRPVLVAVGQRWARTGEGIEIEHVLSDAAIAALRAHQSMQPRPAPARPVLLANARDDLHVLPLHVLAAALAERRVLTLLLGAQVPEAALVAAVRRTRPIAVFLWRQFDATPEPQLAFIPASRPPIKLYLGGQGWCGSGAEHHVYLESLREAVGALAAAASAT